MSDPDARTNRTVARRTAQMLLCAAMAFGLSGCWPCGNEVVYEVHSPNRKHKAIVFVRDCGATTDFSTHVSVVGEGQSLSNSAGNALIMDGDHGKVKTGSCGQLPMHVAWNSDNSVAIRYPEKSRLFLANAWVEGVALTYEASPVSTLKPPGAPGCGNEAAQTR
jgi:hypothetical protein